MKLSRHTNCCTAKHVHRSLVCTLSFGTAELVDATTVSNDQPVGNTSTPSEPLSFEVNCCRMHPVPDRVKSSFVIFQRPVVFKCQKLTQSGTGCFIAVPIGQQWASKG